MTVMMQTFSSFWTKYWRSSFD